MKAFSTDLGVPYPPMIGFSILQKYYRKMVPLTDPQRFSPSKVSRYMVYYKNYNQVIVKVRVAESAESKIFLDINLREISEQTKIAQNIAA